MDGLTKFNLLASRFAKGFKIPTWLAFLDITIRMKEEEEEEKVVLHNVSESGCVRVLIRDYKE